MVPVSMMWPLKVSRSTIAAQSRGSVKVLVQPSGAGTCSLSRVPAATWSYLLLVVVVGSRGGAMMFKVLP